VELLLTSVSCELQQAEDVMIQSRILAYLYVIVTISVCWPLCSPGL